LLARTIDDLEAFDGIPTWPGLQTIAGKEREID
jgi:hypothetical protein